MCRSFFTIDTWIQFYVQPNFESFLINYVYLHYTIRAKLSKLQKLTHIGVKLILQNLINTKHTRTLTHTHTLVGIVQYITFWLKLRTSSKRILDTNFHSSIYVFVWLNFGKPSLRKVEL